MKHRSIIILVSAIIAFAGMSLTGCGGGESGQSSNSDSKGNTKPAAVVIIAGRHANAKMYSEKMIDDASNIIEQSYVIKRDSDKYTGTAQISVIVSDGDPEVVPVELNGEDILTYTSNNAENIRESKKELVSNLKQFLFSPNLKADDSEVDLLLALTRAQSILNEYPNSEHHILVLDTGITTCGTLNMNSINVLSEDNADIIEKIKSGIPDFKGTNITFYGFGNIAGQQSTLSKPDERKKFEQLWESIIGEGDGQLTAPLNYKDVESTVEMQYSEDGDADTYPLVSNVLFYNQASNDLLPETITIEPPVPPEKEYFSAVFHTADLGGFKPDSAEFLNKEVAINTLNATKEKIQACLNGDDAPILYVIGSIAKTAPDSDQRTSNVSYSRAKAMADLLINDYGVPSERIQIIDAGTTVFSWRNAVEFPDGTSEHKDSVAAQNNRVVAIISSNTDSLVDELRYNGYID